MVVGGVCEILNKLVHNHTCTLYLERKGEKRKEKKKGKRKGKGSNDLRHQHHHMVPVTSEEKMAKEPRGSHHANEK